MSEQNPTPGAPPSTFGVMKRCLSYALPYKRRIVFALVLMVLYAGATNLRYGLVGLLADGVLVPSDPAKGKSNVTRFFDEYVEPVIPIKFETTTAYRASHRMLDVEVRSGTFSEDGIEKQGDAWTVSIKDGVLDGQLDDDQDGELDGKLVGYEFRELVIRSPVEITRAEFPLRLEGVVISGENYATRPQDQIYQTLMIVAWAGAILALIIAFSNYGREMFSRSIRIFCIRDMRRDLFGRLSTLSAGFFSRRRSGDLLSRVTNDVNSLDLSLRYIFGDILQQPLVIVGALVIALLHAPLLTLIAVPFLPLLVLPVLRSGRKVKRHGLGSLAKMGEMTQAMNELLSGIRVVKAFQMESAQLRDFDQRNAGFVRSSLQMIRAKVRARSFLEGIYNLLAAVLIAAGAGFLVSGDTKIAPADFLVFLAAITSIYKPMKDLAKAYNTIMESAAGGQRVLEILDEQPQVEDSGLEVFEPLAESIEFDDVSFRYDGDDKLVLDSICLQFRKGETVALVGPSGAGKSTFLDLLARFHDPTSGRILLDGRDLREGTHASLMAQIAIVSQEPFLFHASIEDNIRHGRPGATDDEIVAAARSAAVHDEIEALPDGYATVLGDRGQTLSGGQRQRITIARAMLKNAEILMLDEATSALDTESERKVQAALENLMEGKTTFVIAHRLSTIQHADRIVAMEQGRVVEDGTHDQLSGAGGVYAHLLSLQDRR